MWHTAADRERYRRYAGDTDVYTLAIITVEVHATRVQLPDGGVAWQSTIRYDRLYRRVDGVTGGVDYDLEPVPAEEGGRQRLISLIAEGERGGNRLVVADAGFDAIDVRTVGERVPERGVSSFEVLPGREAECVGLKSVEIDERTETYLFYFDLDGNMLKDDAYLGAYRCEGVEFL